MTYDAEDIRRAAVDYNTDAVTSDTEAAMLDMVAQGLGAAELRVEFIRNRRAVWTGKLHVLAGVATDFGFIAAGPATIVTHTNRTGGSLVASVERRFERAAGPGVTVTVTAGL